MAVKKKTHPRRICRNCGWAYHTHHGSATDTRICALSPREGFAARWPIFQPARQSGLAKMRAERRRQQEKRTHAFLHFTTKDVWLLHEATAYAASRGTNGYRFSKQQRMRLIDMSEHIFLRSALRRA